MSQDTIDKWKEIDPQERLTRIRTQVVKWRDEARNASHASEEAGYKGAGITWGCYWTAYNAVLALLDGDSDG